MRISDWSSDVCSSDLSLLPRLSIQSMDAADREIRSWLAERRSIAIDAPADVPASGHRTITVMLSGGIKPASYKARGARPEAEADRRGSEERRLGKEVVRRVSSRGCAAT